LNITARSYHDTINLGFLGCRDLLPHFQHLAVYTGEALAELERIYGLKTDQPPAPAKSIHHDNVLDINDIKHSRSHKVSNA
ncbi:MAG: WS/DGAT domain-containing protein, partial [Steroidobacteraceae bacterium]